MDWIRSLFWFKKYYNFSLLVKHIPGSINTLADSVSRLDDVKHWPTFLAWLSKSSGSHDFESHMSPLSLALLRSKGPAELDHEVTNYQRQAYAATTKSSYMSQMRSYLSFCVYYGYQPLPAAALTLNRYAAFLARSLYASSIPAYLNAVRILHLEHGLTDPTKNSFQLATKLQGIKRVKGLTVSQKKPITPQILLAFKSHLNLDNPSHATFWAACLVAFFGLLRKANLLCKGLTQFDPSKHLRQGNILFFTDWAIIINRWSKTIQFSQRALTIPVPRIAQHPLCPYTVLEQAFRLVPAPLSGPAFIIPASTEGGLTPLTYGWKV